MFLKLKTPLYLLLALGLMVTSCKKEKPKPVACNSEYEADPVGKWYFGDFHVHATAASNDTGGDSYPQDIKQKAIERGLDFVVLTDHSNSTGSDPSTTFEDPALFNQGPEFPYWNEAESLSDNTFIMIDGNELSPRAPGNNTPTGHIGCIPIDLKTFDPNIAFTDRPMGSVNGAQTLQQSNNAGCFSILNHPYGILTHITYDWTSFDYQAIEVWNGTIGYDDFDRYGRNAWICDLLAGRNVSAVGGSDCHRVFIDPPGSSFDPALGYPTTAVFATSFEWSSIMEGLAAGKTAVFEGDSRLFIDGYDETLCRNETNSTRYIRLRGTLDANLAEADLKLIRSTDCNDPRPAVTSFPEPMSDELLNQAISGGETFDIQVEINGEPGVYTASLGKDIEANYWALSRAIVIN